jgi:hypothetical protein
MRTQLIVAMSTLLLGGVASAQTSLSTIEVRAGANESVTMSCSKPDSVAPQDVQRVLSIDDPSTAPGLRKKLVSAVSAACRQNIPHILVTRGPHGSMTWKQAN